MLHASGDLLGQWFHQHTLHAFKHGVRVLVCVDVLSVCVEIAEFLHVCVIPSETLFDGVLLVTRVHRQSLLDLLCWRWVVKDVVALASHWVSRSKGQSLDDRVVGNV